LPRQLLARELLRKPCRLRLDCRLYLALMRALGLLDVPDSTIVEQRLAAVRAYLD